MAAVTSSVIGAIGVGAQAYGAHKAGKAADKAATAQSTMDKERIALGREQLEWARGVYDQWRSEFDPMLQELKAEAMRDTTPDYAAITADTRTAFSSARDDNRIALERYGIDPSDGAFGANERRFGIGQALAEVGTRQTARRDARGERIRNLAAVYGIGAGLQSSAMGNVSGGFNQIQGAMAGASANYGNNAANHSNNAAAGWSGAWRGLNNLWDTAFAPEPQQSTQPVPDGWG